MPRVFCFLYTVLMIKNIPIQQFIPWISAMTKGKDVSWSFPRGMSNVHTPLNLLRPLPTCPKWAPLKSVLVDLPPASCCVERRPNQVLLSYLALLWPSIDHEFQAFRKNMSQINLQQKNSSISSQPRKWHHSQSSLVLEWRDKSPERWPQQCQGLPCTSLSPPTEASSG